MSYSELMNYSNRRQDQEQDQDDTDDVQRMLADFEQYFSMDKEARQRKLEYLESRQKRIDESLASIERKQKIDEVVNNHHQNQVVVVPAQNSNSNNNNMKNKKLQIDAPVYASGAAADGDGDGSSSTFLHNKVVQLAKALAKMTRERDRLDLELAKTKVDLAGEKEKNYKNRRSPSSDNNNNNNNNPYIALEIEKDIWRQEIVALRNALEHHVASDRKDRHTAQQDKEEVLNEVAEELGQVMAQRDLAYVELEKLKRFQDFSNKKLLQVNKPSSSSTSTAVTNVTSSALLPIELETAEKQISALQLQLAHARRDVTVQSVNLHVANEKYTSLREDVEKVCSAFQTTTTQCNSALSILSSAQQQLREKPYSPGKTSYAKLTSSQISELMLFISRVRSDFSNISSLLEELRSNKNESNNED